MLIPLRLDLDHDRRPAATAAVIAVNVMVAAWTITLAPDRAEAVMQRYGCRPDDLAPLTFITSPFLHAGLLHLFVNMYFLWIFGRAVEQAAPRWAWIAVYLGSGAAANLAQSFLGPPSISDIPMIGASGAISGMLGAAALLFPTTPVHCVFFSRVVAFPKAMTLPAGIVLGVWFVGQMIWAGLAPGTMMIAFWAHAGGFVAGGVAGGVLRAHLAGRPSPSKAPRMEDLAPVLDSVRTGDLDAATRTVEELSGSGEALELARTLAGTRTPSEGVAVAETAGHHAACASAYAVGLSRGARFDAGETAAAVRSMRHLRRDLEAGAALKHYCREGGDPAGEAQLLLEAGRALIRGKPPSGRAVLERLVKAHPSSPACTTAQRLLAGSESN